MDGGTYTLILDRTSGGSIEVGALGQREFPAGSYAYTGSALGTGGFARIDRHREIAVGDRETRHWHIDYLLGGSATTIDTVVTTEADIECAVAQHLTARAERCVEGFGCSDCDCDTHLVADSDHERLVQAVENVHKNVIQ
jgi:endonuclease-3